MSQNKRGSFYEACLNVAVGGVVALIAQIIVFPLIGIMGVAYSTHLLLSCIFTVISLVRSYVIRRYFNGLRYFTQED